MLSHTLTRAALKARLLTLQIATTGSVTLSATATGYARASGSFVSDGFVVGMELTPTGFPTNPVDVITDVTATLITTRTAHPTASASAARSLTVGLPSMRAFDDEEIEPDPGTPYVTAEFSPSTNTLVTIAENYGRAEETGEYFITVYYPKGHSAVALSPTIEALRALFTAGTKITVGSDTLRLRWNPAPRAGAFLPDGPFMRCQFTAWWACDTRNLIAA